MEPKKVKRDKTLEKIESFSELLNGPVLLAKRAAVVLLDPEAHAAVVERVVALAPDDDALLETNHKGSLT